MTFIQRSQIIFELRAGLGF